MAWLLIALAMVSPASAKGRQFAPYGLYGGWQMNFAGPGGYFGQPIVPQSAPASPYAMSYADEVVQALGLKNGPANLLSSGSGKGNARPAFSGGIGHNGVLFKLQW